MKNILQKFLKINEVLDYLQISRGTLYSLIKKEAILKPIKIGNSSFWRMKDLEAYVGKGKCQEEKFLKINEVLDYLQISRGTLYSLIKKESILKPIKIGNSSFWRMKDLEEFIEMKIAISKANPDNILSDRLIS